MPHRKILAMLVAVLLIGLGLATPAMAASGTAKTSISQSAAARQVFSPAQRALIDRTFTQQEIAQLLQVATATPPPNGMVSAAAAARPSVARKVVPNGCTRSPDRFIKANFRPACDAHDRCYGSSRNRLDCDKVFVQNLQYACRLAYPWYNPARGYCYQATGVYYTAVRAVGDDYYKGTGRNN